MSCHSTSGGIVSTSLARAVSGLSEKEIQHIFHALKREAAGMASPSELDVAEWRSRQYDLLTRMRKMTDKRRDKLRDRIFRSRSESVPDGATFHAWKTIEARARQQKALSTITTAVDLEPPGSQAHLYDLGEDGRPTKVWYASYGSNLHRDRFMNYIEGGSPEGSTRTYDGCTDPTPPEADIPIRFAGARPHFALTSRVWRGGIAFIDAQKGESAQGLGRAYEIGITQFDEVVAQENGLPAKWATPVPLDEALSTGRAVIGNGSYETILHIGDYNGAPVLTFTAPFSTREALTRTGHILRTPVGQKTAVRMPVMTNKPSPAYLRMIGGGLGETFGMTEIQQADYLRGCPGGDRWTRQQMVRILRGEEPDPPRAPGPENPKKPTKQGKPSSTTPSTTKPPTGYSKTTGPSMTGKPASSVTVAFSNPTSATGSTPADNGSVLNDLRQQGLFPAEPNPARSPRGNRRRSANSQTTRAATTSTTVQTRRTNGTRTIPNVKNYASTEEQNVGIKRWAQTVAKFEKEHQSIAAATQSLETGLAELKAQPTPNPGRIDATERNLQAAKDRLGTATTLLNQAQDRLRTARNRTPPRYYSPTSNRTLAQWQDEDTRLIDQHRTTEQTYDSARRHLAKLRTSPTATADETAKAQRNTERLRNELDTYARRLKETHAIITSLLKDT